VTWILRHLWVAGVLLLLAAVGWWGVVFATVVRSGYLLWPQAAVCLALRTSTCELAMSLCIAGNRHLLGITRYAPDLLWVGLSLLVAQLALHPSGAGVRGRARLGRSARR
jgi:hypothetical protein